MNFYNKMVCPEKGLTGCENCYHAEAGHNFMDSCARPGCHDKPCIPYREVRKIYLASRFANRFNLRKSKKKLEKMGYKITCRWITHHTRPKNQKLVDEQWKNGFAKEDIEDMDEADMIIVYTVGCIEDPPRGGMRFEEGYFYGKGKPILIVGPRIFIFDFLSDIPVVDDWKACYEYMKRKYPRRGK